MTEQLLDPSQVCPSLQQMGGEGVPQGMGMQSMHARQPPRCFHPSPHRARLHAGASGIQEQRLFGVDGPPLVHTAGQPVLHRLQGVPPHWHLASLATLAEANMHQALGSVDVADVEGARLTHPQPGPVQQLQERSILRLERDVVEQSLSANLSENVGQTLTDLGGLQGLSHVHPHVPEPLEPSVEGANGGNVPSHRGPTSPPTGIEEEGPQIDPPRVEEAPLTPMEHLHESLQRPPIGPASVLRPSSLHVEMAQEVRQQGRIRGT